MKKFLAELAYRLPRFRGRDRLLRGALNFLARSDHFVVIRGGISYELAGEDIIDYYISSQTLESPEVTEFLIKAIGNAPVRFWDIGANIGGVTLPLLHHCPELTAVSFEPSPSVCGRLLNNLGVNPALQGRCTPVPAAVSDTTTWTNFFVSSERFNSGVGGLKATTNRQGFGPTVPVIRGEEAAGLFGGPPDVIKIDVEGFEEEAIRGLGALLERDLLIVFEHSLYRFIDRGLAPDSVVRLLEDKGYEVKTLTGAVPDLTHNADFVARRRENSRWTF